MKSQRSIDGIITTKKQFSSGKQVIAKGQTSLLGLIENENIFSANKRGKDLGKSNSNFYQRITVGELVDAHKKRLNRRIISATKSTEDTNRKTNRPLSTNNGSAAAIPHRNNFMSQASIFDTLDFSDIDMTINDIAIDEEYENEDAMFAIPLRLPSGIQAVYAKVQDFALDIYEKIQPIEQRATSKISELLRPKMRILQSKIRSAKLSLNRATLPHRLSKHNTILGNGVSKKIIAVQALLIILLILLDRALKRPTPVSSKQPRIRTGCYL